MTEIVAGSRAYHRQTWVPSFERLGRHSVYASVMRNQDDIDIRDGALTSQSVPYDPFGITGKHRRERTPCEVKDHAGVVR